MVIPAQLLTPTRTDALQIGSNGGATRTADKNDQKFSAMLDLSAKGAKDALSAGGNVRRKTGDKPASANNAAQSKRAMGPEQDYYGVAAYAQDAQTNDAQLSTAAQDAPMTTEPQTAASVDILEGVELLNMLNASPESGDASALALPVIDEQASADAESLGAADETLKNAASDIQYVSGRISDPLENVSNNITARVLSAQAEQPQQAVAPDEEAAEIVAPTASDQTQPEQHSASGGAARGEASGADQRAVSGGDAADGLTASIINPFAQSAPLSEVTQGAGAASRLQESVFDQTIEGIQSMLSDSKQSLTIQMKPEFLGHLAIELTMGKDGLTALIRSNDAGVRGLLGAELTALTQALKEKGIEVKQVEVAQSGMADLAGQYFQDRNAARQHAFGGNTSRGARILTADGALTGAADAVYAPDATAALGAPTPDMMGASVEFIA